jgi:hypothetical protein
MGSRSIRQQFEVLKEKYGVDFAIETPTLDRIELAEQVRHIFVHNGGKVDREFLARTHKRRGLGRTYPLTRKFLELTATDCVVACGAVFEAISLKHFKVSEQVLKLGIVRFQKAETKARVTIRR